MRIQYNRQDLKKKLLYLLRAKLDLSLLAVSAEGGHLCHRALKLALIVFRLCLKGGPLVPLREDVRLQQTKHRAFASIQPIC